MNIIERGQGFFQGLREQAARRAWEWRRCPYCGDTLTCKYGRYRRRPWGLHRREVVAAQRRWCHGCQRTYSEQSALWVRGSWYGRAVQRSAIDHWQHGRLSVRRTAEVVRSWLGQQESWHLWCPLSAPRRRRRGVG